MICLLGTQFTNILFNGIILNKPNFLNLIFSTSKMLFPFALTDKLWSSLATKVISFPPLTKITTNQLTVMTRLIHFVTISGVMYLKYLVQHLLPKAIT